LGTDDPEDTHIHIQALAWSPDGQTLVFSSNRADRRYFNLWKVKTDGTGLTQLTSGAWNDNNPTWSPDGTKIAFDSDRGGVTQVYVITADGAGLTQLTTERTGNEAPAWSPDGTKIAFSAQRGGIIVMTTSGQELNYVASVSAAWGVPSSHGPTWLFDGSKIAYVVEKDVVSGMTIQGLITSIAIANPDGTGKALLLPQGDYVDGFPVANPTNHTIAFEASRSYAGDPRDFGIWLVNADGTNLRRIPDIYEFEEGRMSWSPDGQKIAFARLDETRNLDQIWTVNADGTGLQQLTTWVAKGASPSKGRLVRAEKSSPPQISKKTETQLLHLDTAPTPHKMAASASTRPTPQERARLRGKVERATKVGGGVALGVFLVWVLAYRHRFEGKSPLDAGI